MVSKIKQSRKTSVRGIDVWVCLCQCSVLCSNNLLLALQADQGAFDSCTCQRLGTRKESNTRVKIDIVRCCCVLLLLAPQAVGVRLIMRLPKAGNKEGKQNKGRYPDVRRCRVLPLQAVGVCLILRSSNAGSEKLTQSKGTYQVSDHWRAHSPACWLANAAERTKCP